MEFIIPNHPFSSSGKELKIFPDNLIFGKPDNYLLIDQSKIQGFKYGVKWIDGLKTYIGRQFIIYIRYDNDAVLKLTFSSLYRYKLKKKQQLFSEILNALWGNFFYKKVIDLVKEFNSGNEINVGDVRISHEGIELMLPKIFSERKCFIPWSDIGTREYQTYFAVFSKIKSAEYNRGFNYLEDWNSLILNRVMTQLLEEKSSLVDSGSIKKSEKK